MIYRGCEIKLDGGRYKGYTPEGEYFCSGDKAFVQGQIRQLLAARASLAKRERAT